jgi:hypothetical protein
MKINKVHCLFEQSGTFKNEFIKLGIPAEDYDIQNEFGETDHIIDIFENIKGGGTEYGAIPHIARYLTGLKKHIERLGKIIPW